MTAVVALTGGIASGKTTVSDRIGELGVPVIDTDRIARELVVPDAPALKAIESIFGPTILMKDGGLDRRRLRDLVFDDATLRQKLEAVLHPAILQEALERIGRLNSDWCLLVVPLLVGSPLLDKVDRVLVVDTPVGLQLERLTARDAVTMVQAEAAIAAQPSREARLAIADDVIVNDDTKAALLASVDQLYQRYNDLFASQ